MGFAQKACFWNLLLMIKCVLVITAEDFDLTIFHINDFHVRFEETDTYSSACSQKQKDAGDCFGGLARLHQTVEDLKREEKNVMFLNAGDMYQGTVWYTKFKSDVVWPFMNMMNFTASALGNHEFDDKPEGLLPLAQNANFDLVCANCDFSNVPAFDGLIKPSVVKEVGGRKIGIIGYTTAFTAQSSNPQAVTFSDELAAVKAQAKLLKDAGVDIIIGLGHVGYDMDKNIAGLVPELDLVIGAHTHSFLYTGNDLPSVEVPEGGYPTMVKQGKTGKTVPVVQAYAYTKYLGYIKLKFDDNGEMLSIDGKPLLLDSSYPQSPDILEKMKPWRERLRSIMSRVIGSTRYLLETSRTKESTLGDFVTDAMLDWHENNVNQDAEGIPKYIVALHNSGGLRVSLEPGNITSADLLTVLPFSNTFDTMTLDAATIQEVLEVSASFLEPDGSGDSGGFLQVAGMRFTIDLKKGPGSRVSNLRLKSSKGGERYEKVAGSTPVLVYLLNYLARGRDGFEVIKEKRKNHVIGVLDTAVVEAYIRKKSPVEQKLDGRVSILTAQSDEPSSTDGDSTPTMVIIVLVVAVVIAVAFSAGCVWRSKKKKKEMRVNGPQA